MHHVSRIDWSFVDAPLPPSATSVGLARSKLIGPDQGAVHTDLVAVALHPDGWLAPHVHSFEEVIYLLEGELYVLIGDTVHHLVAGDYALFPTAVRHGLGGSGERPARFLSLASPQRLAPDAGRKDTFFEPAPAAYREDLAARGARPSFGSPTLRFVGHYEGTGPQLETLRIKDPARGRASAGRDTALVVYSGISVKMLVDPLFGADHTTMFTVDYEVGGAAQAHDHPFEETYVFLAGEVEGELDGQRYTFRPGDIAFAPTGCVHGFWNEGTERVRWLETQAPQPPTRHSYRWIRDWERYEEEHR
jgi:quercetin dioxygenase-like cupin family protein